MITMVNSNQEHPLLNIDPTAILTLSASELKLVRWISRNPVNDVQTLAEAAMMSIEEVKPLLTGLIKQGILSKQATCRKTRKTSYRLLPRQQRKPRKRSKLAKDLWSRL